VGVGVGVGCGGGIPFPPPPPPPHATRPAVNTVSPNIGNRVFTGRSTFIQNCGSKKLRQSPSVRIEPLEVMRRKMPFFDENDPTHGYVEQHMRAFAVLGLVCSLACLGVGSAFARTPMRDGAVIRNSGSTNFAGYIIKVWSDASASAAPANRAGQPTGPPAYRRIPKSVTQKFFHDLREARAHRVISQPCMKSASFGTVTVVTWHGWTSPDLQCPGGGSVTSLANEVRRIVSAAGPQGTPKGRAVPLLRNERRRAPVEASSAPSAEPSTSPTGEPTTP
jgi:hypothetical protein